MINCFDCEFINSCSKSCISKDGKPVDPDQCEEKKKKEKEKEK